MDDTLESGWTLFAARLARRGHSFAGRGNQSPEKRENMHLLIGSHLSDNSTTLGRDLVKVRSLVLAAETVCTDDTLMMIFAKALNKGKPANDGLLFLSESQGLRRKDSTVRSVVEKSRLRERLPNKYFYYFYYEPRYCYRSCRLSHLIRW